MSESDLRATTRVFMSAISRAQEDFSVWADAFCQSSRDLHVENGAGAELQYYDVAVAAFKRAARAGENSASATVDSRSDHSDEHAPHSHRDRFPLAERAAALLRTDGFEARAERRTDRDGSGPTRYVITIHLSW